jgi:hypothetical protein
LPNPIKPNLKFCGGFNPPLPWSLRQTSVWPDLFWANLIFWSFAKKCQSFGGHGENSSNLVTLLLCQDSLRVTNEMKLAYLRICASQMKWNLRICAQEQTKEILALEAVLPDFSWSKHTKLGKIYKMTINYTKRP